MKRIAWSHSAVLTGAAERMPRLGCVLCVPGVFARLWDWTYEDMAYSEEPRGHPLTSHAPRVETRTALAQLALCPLAPLHSGIDAPSLPAF